MKMKTRRDMRESRRYMRDDAAGCTIVTGIRAKAVVVHSAEGSIRATVRVDEKRFSIVMGWRPIRLIKTYLSQATVE